jgi:DNA-binding transcriptional regulator YhcF (GntR family)
LVADDLVDRISGAIDQAQPTPLYHQVAEVIRWEIERGRIAIGSLLPPIRRLARAAGINYHTVRRGYEQLEAEGVVRSRRGVGVRVQRAPTSKPWTPAGLATDRDETPRCWVVDRSLTGAASLATPVGAEWRIGAAAFAWAPDAPPPSGPILLPTALGPTALAAWPDREGDLHPLDLVLEGATLAVVRRNVELLGADGVRIHLGASGGAPRELHAQLPRVGIRVAVADDDEPVDPDGSALALVTAEVWEGLSWELQRHPRVMPLGWRFAPGPLARVARALEWKER